MHSTNPHTLVSASGSGGLTTNSHIIAEGTDSQHRAVLQLIKANQSDFEEFGRVAFEMQPFETAGGTQNRTIAILNREQAMLLMTYMRNNVIIKRFKKNLIHAFAEMERKLAAPAELSGPELMAKALLEANSTLKAAEVRADTAEAALQSAAPVLDYHEKYVAEDDDLLTIDNWARQAGTSGPKARALLIEKNIIFRQHVGSRWSQSKQRMITEYEYRARAGRATSDWFQLRPQHNAPRLHNGQVRQTLYVLAYRADDLAKKLGLNGQKELSA